MNFVDLINALRRGWLVPGDDASGIAALEATIGPRSTWPADPMQAAEDAGLDVEIVDPCGQVEVVLVDGVVVCARSPDAHEMALRLVRGAAFVGLTSPR